MAFAGRNHRQRHGDGGSGDDVDTVCDGVSRVAADLRAGQARVKIPHFAMVNLIAGEEVVPELVQHDFTAQNIVDGAEPDRA